MTVPPKMTPGRARFSVVRPVLLSDTSPDALQKVPLLAGFSAARADTPWATRKTKKDAVTTVDLSAGGASVSRS